MDVLCEPTAFLTLNKRLFSRNDWVRHTCHCFTNHYIVRVPHKSQVLVYAQDNERNDLLLERDSAQLEIYSIASDSGLKWTLPMHAPAHALINVTLIHIIYDVVFSDILWSSPFCIHVFTSKCWILQFDDLLRGNPVIHMPCRSYALWFLRHCFAINQSIRSQT